MTQTTAQVLEEQERQAAASMESRTKMSNHHLDFELNLDEIEGSKYSLLPAGSYEAEIVSATIASTKKGNGQIVNISWAITSGEYEKRRIFQNIVVQHTSAEAQEIGRRTIKDISSACGVTGQLTDLETLRFKPCMLSVKIEPGNDQYEAKNRVSKVFPIKVAATPEQVRQKQQSEAAKVKKPQDSKPDDPDDEIPF
jgi:hypothetical protein